MIEGLHTVSLREWFVFVLIAIGSIAVGMLIGWVLSMGIEYLFYQAVVNAIAKYFS